MVYNTLSTACLQGSLYLSCTVQGVLGYRMETGEDLVKFKENKTTVFPSTAWLVSLPVGGGGAEFILDEVKNPSPPPLNNKLLNMCLISNSL